MSSGPRAGTVVIGLGNPLMGDDGLGLAALTRLRDGWAFDPPVALIDGGTWGLTLLPVIEDAERVVLLDAVNIGAPAGAFVRLGRGDIPRVLATKLSPHQIDMREVLALAELRGTLPASLVAIGLQPAEITMRTSLSGPVAAGLPGLMEQVLAQLAAWGHRALPIETGLARA
jgi:hydrogenase maturation protease